MSFKNLKHHELVKATEYFDVPDVSESNTRTELIAALEESEISWSNYKKFVAGNDEQTEEPIVEEAKEVLFNKMVLLKMERKNARFDILGRTFTREQPFQVMSEHEAQDIIDTADTMGGGFRIASPAEAKSYFG